MPDTIQVPFSGKPAYGHCMSRECPANGKEFRYEELKEVRNPKTQEKRVFCNHCVEFLTQRFTSSQMQAQGMWYNTCTMLVNWHMWLANYRDVTGVPDAQKGSSNEIKGSQISEDRAKRVQRDIARAQRGSTFFAFLSHLYQNSCLAQKQMRLQWPSLLSRVGTIQHSLVMKQWWSQRSREIQEYWQVWLQLHRTWLHQEPEQKVLQICQYHQLAYQVFHEAT